ncbi:MAG: hypothetical protein DI536_29625 [Archangium gephyra]|uniref:PDZ domain-containing protein n=1 Tax=Archangium gephyra TaxID=48 RepID=A0A2W5STR4_9BACT|nr:MAG: hypothetical protein DI536_29625 [Archangium gephyra]
MMKPAPPTLDETLAQTEWVRRLARSLVSDADADDLAQDAWEASLSVDDPSRGWFAGALRNLAAFRHRTTARRVRRDAATERPEPEPTPDVVMERLEAQRQLTTLVSALPEPTRTVLYLRYFEGLDATAIGQRLQLPPGTVRWRLKQGLDVLRAQLDERLGGRERWSALLLPLTKLDGPPLHLAGVAFMKLKKLFAVTVAALLLVAAAFVLRCSSGPAPTVTVITSKPDVAAPVARRVANAPELPNSPLPAWRAQAGAPSRRVAGRVMLDGAPLEGAVVTLTIDEQPSEAPPQQRVSANDGTFDFGVQPAASVGVGAFVDGHAPTVVELDLRNPEAQPPPDALELVVPSGCPALLTGRVLDSGSGPVSDATVRPARTIGAQTDAQGSYALCLPLGENELVVEAASYGAMSMRLTLQGPLQRDVVLTPAAVIEGVVVDAAERPVADAIVSSRQRMWQNNDMARPGFARSDVMGRFSLSVAPGDYRVQATAGGSSSSTIQVVSAMVGEPSRKLVLVVKPAVRIRGIVSSDGKPVPGARVTAHTVATGRAVDAFSQNDGRFVIDGVPPGELVFTAEPWAVDQPRRYVAKADAPEVTLQVKRMAVVRGVVTRDKKPVAGAKVTAKSMWGDVKAVSDANGRYALEGLNKGGHQVMANSEAEGAFVLETVSIKGREQVELDLELSSAAFVDGTLVDEKNQPIEGARVVWTGARQDDEGTATTDAKGHFHAAQLTGGDTYAPQVYLSGQVSAVGAKPANGAFPKVKLADGHSKAENVRLQVKVEKLTLSGRVVDLQGNPVADAKVRAKPASHENTFSPYEALPQVFTDAQGRFTFEALQSGTWSVQARSARGEEAMAKGEAGARELVITLRPTATVEGKLVGYANTPVVYASRGSGGFVSGQVTGETFRLVLAAGEWTITAMDNLEGDIKKVTLKDGEARELTFQSHGTGKLTGRLIDFESGQPVPNVMCRTILAVGSTPGITNWDSASVPMSDEEGRFVFESAPAGHVLVACLGDEVQSGGSAFVDLPRGGALNVTIKVVLRTGRASGHGIGIYDLSTKISEVLPDSPAAKAGLQAGDVLLAIDGRPVTELDPDSASALLDNHAPGAMSLSVQRAGAPINVTLTLPR